MSQECVILTNDDASSCKRSASQLGYWDDPFIKLFVRRYERKAPEINRGYYARVRGIERLVEWFLARHDAGSVQLVSLGAGFDTLYWRLRRRGVRLRSYVELDFPQVTGRKLQHIRQQPTLLSAFDPTDGEVRVSQTALHAPDYHLVPVDISQPDQVLAALDACRLADDAPTLVLAECVLVYVSSDAVHRLLTALAARLSTALFVNYEMVGIDDRFGDILVQNVRGRGCDLAGIAACLSARTQTERFRTAGWSGARVWNMNEVLEQLPAAEVQRVQRLELLDEVDVLQQLLQHYGIAVAWTDPQLRDVGFG